ncbi:glucose-6-phosphate isomerase [Candidatus Koribacter versatilis Ellin345]|uniref:glucose-6-phosphate isomerase n=1 Tax=Koribacter versatilis (strain Ellin345) TaxID=204669 RepID=Q1ITZ2_KORVE|nr:glucose-6-phosphate isomerase family protein [Candidatus Koribacter versatilis]ABF39658.1 glucose-6-phosphate isomerase [Candidatus Koribacter versatilis Ellin345]
MNFDPKLGVHCSSDMHFSYDDGVFGPAPEFRQLNAIRRSLRDPNCKGPDPVYSIVMDVGRESDRAEMQRRMILYGVVAYAAGRLGDEPVRSQGHIHAIAPHCGWSTPELFEIWEGLAIIYAQERATDDPGRCFAVVANPGDKVVVPPSWAHCVINADPNRRMVFGAWCDRQYGFVYDEVRAHGGLAWFPVFDAEQNILWEANPRYRRSEITVREPRAYPELGITPGTPMYQQFVADPESLQWVSQPARVEKTWDHFEP